jgi:hypothetical protein
MRTTATQLIKNNGTILLIIRTVIHDNADSVVPVTGHGTGRAIGCCSDKLTEDGTSVEKRGALYGCMSRSRRLYLTTERLLEDAVQ